MRTVSRTPLSLVVMLLLSLASATPLMAQDGPSASETALAREQFREGMAHAQAGRWPEAHAAFQRAYGLVRRPLVLLNLASAEEQTGRLVESAEHYRQFLREVTSGREAQQRSVAEQGVARVEARIPRARFMLAGARSSDTYALDDKPIATAAMGTALPLDPGPHTLVVFSAGSEIGRVAFTLAEGEAKDVLVTVTRPVERVAAVEPAAGDGATNTRVAILPRNGEDALPAARGTDEDDGGVLASPVFWIIVGVVVVGGATAGILVTTSGGSDPYSGNLGSIPIR